MLCAWVLAESVWFNSSWVWLMAVCTSGFSTEAHQVQTIGEDGIFSHFCSWSNFSTLVVVVGASFPILPLAYYKPRTDCLSCSQQGNRFCFRSCFSIKVLQGRRSWWYWKILCISVKKGRPGFKNETQSLDALLVKREKTWYASTRSHLPFFASKNQSQENNLLVLTWLAWSPTESSCLFWRVQHLLRADQDDDQGEFSAEGPRPGRGAGLPCQGLWLCSPISVQEEAEVIPAGPGLTAWSFFHFFCCFVFSFNRIRESNCVPSRRVYLQKGICS